MDWLGLDNSTWEKILFVIAILGILRWFENLRDEVSELKIEVEKLKDRLRDK